MTVTDNVRNEEVRVPTAQAAFLGLDLAVELGAALDADEIQRRIPMRAAQASRADRATLIRLCDEELVVEHGYDRDGRRLGAGLRSFLADEPVYQLAFRSRAAVEAAGPQFDGFPPAGSNGGHGHVLVLPLTFRREIVGFLNLVRADTPFDPRSALTVHVIATVAAVSLRNARRLAESEEARSSMKNLLDVVVHELRSPLTVASGYVRMLRDGTIEPGAAAAPSLETVQDKLAECQRLVDELLLAARLESGTVPSDPRVVDLTALARDAVDRARPRAEMVGATVCADAPQGMVLARADAARVGRILNNLVSNAIDHGGRRPQVTVTTADDGLPFISVSDQGPGISAADRERIFERFVRGDRSGGSGLGLFLSRQLAEASGGSLDLDSDRGGPGARFVLRLPASTALYVR